MTEHSKEQRITVIGIDLAKRSFHLCALDAQGRRVISKSVSRAKLAEQLAKLPPVGSPWRPVAVPTTGRASFSRMAMR